MNPIIRIGKPYIEQTAERKYRLCAQLREDGREPYTAWYEVDEQYGAYLCEERTDAFAVVLLPYALRRGLDIHCEQVMSERLYYQLSQILLPTLGGRVGVFKRISLVAETSSAVLPSFGARGASVSGGVDSFYTLLNHTGRREAGFNVTHLAFFNIGSHGDYGGEDARKLFHKRMALVSPIADELGLSLVGVDTNLSEFLRLDYVGSHTYRTLSVVLALQKLFSAYFFASGYPYQKFGLSSKGPAQFDLLNVQCLTTENVVFYLSGAERTRQEKLDFIADHEITYRHLNVCVTDGPNCSRCTKCRRTMMGLYLHGKLELYRPVFDVDSFLTRVDAQITEAYSKSDDADWTELYHVMRDRKMMRPRHYILGGLRRGMRKLINGCAPVGKLFLKLRNRGA